MKHVFGFAAGIVLIVLTTGAAAEPAPAVNPADGDGIFNIVFENDLFANTDQDYTNGIRLAWLSGEKNLPDWVQSLAHILPVAGDGNKRISVALGQNMYTPADLGSSAPIPGQHPYAGWLYGSVGMVSDTGHGLDNVMFTAGVVGPYAMAGETQKLVHRIIGAAQPMGWSNQLKNEPGFIFTYEHKWRGLYEFSPFGVGLDATPQVGINLGNVTTDASVGATFRLGYDLPSDYGPPRIRPSLPGSDFFIAQKNLGGYLFATLEGRAVGRNIFLDGNSFAKSLHVDKENLVGSVQLGAAITYHDLRLSYTQVFMTKEYTTQVRGDQFGVVTLSYRF